jgi:hypothetical protein
VNLKELAMHNRPNNALHITFMFVILLTMGITVRSQSLEEKLSQVADFAPSNSTTEARLIELAQHYKIPMGIEWISDENQAPISSPVSSQSSVREMLDFILRGAPGYRSDVKDGMVIVRKAPWSEDARNFLNLRLTEYRIDHGNVIHAEAALRFGIHATLHPERYAGGYTGGYGYGALPESFRLQNVSISARNITVREVLNGIILQNANSLWVVELVPSKMIKGEPYFAPGSSPKDARTDFFWRILPFE